MNKYSTKIIKFINNNNFKNNNFKNTNLENNLFISKILNICKEICNITLPKYNINHNKISKIHSVDEYPQLYEIYKNNIPNIKTFIDFIKYYSLNIHDLYDFKNDLINKNTKDRKELIDIFYNNFQSIDIIQEIETHDLTHIEVQIDNIRISLYYYDNTLDINEIISNIIKITLLIDKIAHLYNIHPNNYNIIIFLGKNKKYLFNNTKIITPMNINSGSTLFSSYVCLWRLEEYEKVLIHELLHYIGIDHQLFTDISLNNKINMIFKIVGKNHINESYNECVASIINMCWKSIKYNININKIYDLETKFLIFQTNKIIKFFDGNKAEDLFNINIIQTTSALSYIIIKTILFINITEILHLINYIKIKFNNNNIILYQNLLLDLLQKKNYIQILNNNFNVSIDKNKFIGKTMRMSVL